MDSNPEKQVSLTDNQDPKALLKSYLSTTAFLSHESLASITQEYPYPPTTGTRLSKPEQYTSIGHGQCAEIFGQSSSIALKKAHPPQEKHAEVANDSIHHQSVVSAFKKYAKLCHVPEYHSLVFPGNEEWYAEFGSLVPNSKLEIATGSRERTPILAMERIPPLLSQVRSALISHFCPEHLRQAAVEDPENRDCLLRLYLGLRNPTGYASTEGKFLSRNFPLSLDRMASLDLELNVEARRYAEAIAEGLAILHWGAGCDGRDVEFVLGSPRIREGKEKGNTVWVWLLDFNQCESIRRDERGIEMAAGAFWDNDPYFPRPGKEGKDGVLWEDFKEKYLAISGDILGTEGPGGSALPQSFIECIVEMGKCRSGIPVAEGPPRKGRRKTRMG